MRPRNDWYHHLAIQYSPILAFLSPIFGSLTFPSSDTCVIRQGSGISEQFFLFSAAEIIRKQTSDSILQKSYLYFFQDTLPVLFSLLTRSLVHALFYFHTILQCDSQMNSSHKMWRCVTRKCFVTASLDFLRFDIYLKSNYKVRQQSGQDTLKHVAGTLKWPNRMNFLEPPSAFFDASSRQCPSFSLTNSMEIWISNQNASYALADTLFYFSFLDARWW